MDYDEEPNASAESEPAESSDNTFYLPSDLTAGLNCKPGDTLTFRVVGKDEEGNVEVERVGDDGDDWETDFDNHMPASMGGRREE